MIKREIPIFVGLEMPMTLRRELSHFLFVTFCFVLRFFFCFVLFVGFKGFSFAFKNVLFDSSTDQRKTNQISLDLKSPIIPRREPSLFFFATFAFVLIVRFKALSLIESMH